MTAIFTEDELSNIRVLKLNNGNEIVSVVLAILEEGFLVKRPCSVSSSAPDANGNSMLILYKWHLLSNEEKHLITPGSVVSFAKVTPDVTKYYINCVRKQIADETNTLSSEDDDKYTWPDWTNEVDPSKVS